MHAISRQHLQLAGLTIMYLLSGIRAEEITVFAATSLTESLKEVAVAYEKNSGDKVILNFAASNILTQQIIAGAPADIFFSADEAKMDVLAKQNLIVADTRKNLLGNSLVIITPVNGLKISEPENLLKSSIKHLSIGNPEVVPAGIYAKAWLEKVGLWGKLKSRTIQAENVRAALAVVESGNAEAGIVYKTDASSSDKIWVQLKIPAEDTPPIVYPVTLLTDSRNKQASRKFLSYLSNESAKKTFVKFGFSVIE